MNWRSKTDRSASSSKRAGVKAYWIEQMAGPVTCMAPNSVSGAKTLQVEISDLASDSRADVSSVLLGLQLTAQPATLLEALLVWRDSAGRGPRELLDRLERILVRRS